MDDLVELGRTAGAYGFRGWVRIVPLESGEVLQKARTWVLTDLKGVRTTLSIEAFRRHGDGFIAKWAGCETKEAADAARGRVSVSRADFPDAGKDAVWAVDLVGCKVVNKEGTALGTVESIGSIGAQDLLVIAYDYADGKKAVFTDPVDYHLDLADSMLTLHFLLPPRGLAFGWLMLREPVSRNDGLGIVPIAMLTHG